MLRRIARALGPRRRRFWPAGGRPSSVQSGAIPYAWAGGRPAYLLITSRRTGRWIFPKGEVADGLTPARSAAKEAWEEAGVRGRIGKTAVGTYRTEKIVRHSRHLIVVDLYPLEVEDQARDWPERRRRRRHWATHRQARRLIDNAELIAALDRLHADLTGPDTERPTSAKPPKRRQPAKASKAR